jgi:hypothetical protein
LARRYTAGAHSTIHLHPAHDSSGLIAHPVPSPPVSRLASVHTRVDIDRMVRASCGCIEEPENGFWSELPVSGRTWRGLCLAMRCMWSRPF